MSTRATEVSPEGSAAELSQLPGSNVEWVRVATAASLESEGPFAVCAQSQDVVLVRVGGHFKAYAGRCPHQGALLGEGELEAGALVCRNHRWRFDVQTGRQLGAPGCLTAFPVKEEHGGVWIGVDPSAPAPAQAAKVQSKLRKLEDLPSPPGLPVVGNLFQLDLERLHEVFESWARTYGPMFVVRAGPRRILTINDAQMNLQVARARPETYRRIRNIEPVFAELGVGGVFSVEGAAWRPLRRLAMKALSQRHLRGFHPTLHEVTQRLLRRWQRAAEEQRELDIKRELKRFTVDITTLLAFGYDVNTLEHDDNPIQELLDGIFPAFNRRVNAPFPYWRWFRLPEDRRLDRRLAQIRTWLTEVVQSSRARLAADPARAATPTHFLEAMLVARDEAGQPFSEEQILGNAMTMLVAGEDTTADTLAWVVHHLCDAPEVVAALRAEADSVVGSDPVPRDLDTASRLSYATAVINETMRLRPIGPLHYLEPNEDVVLGDVEVPKGTTLFFTARLALQDEKNFTSPLEFIPRRWLDGQAAGAHNPAISIPFGTGPRICPGRSLALLEMRVFLAAIYKNFDVERVGRSAEVTESFSFTMSPKNLRVRLRRRRGADQPSGA